jgi:hypothetical protein
MQPQSTNDAMGARNEDEGSLVHSRMFVGCAVAFFAVLVFLAAGVALCYYVFCVRFFSSEPYEHEHMTYEEFSYTYRTNNFNLDGASDISVKNRATRDSYDMWVKAALPPAAYEAAWGKRDRDQSWKTEHCGTMSGKPLRRTATTVVPHPNEWPSPEIPRPKWWVDGPGSYECTAWQTFAPGQTRHATGEPTGELWIYDAKARLLWIWRWERPFLVGPGTTVVTSPDVDVHVRDVKRTKETAHPPKDK